MNKTELRCGNKLHGILLAATGSLSLEFKCDSRYCGARSGQIVLHRFHLTDGRMTVDTRKFREPSRLSRR